MSHSQSDTNLLPIAEEYFKTIFADITGMKAIILDAQSIGIISVIYSQSKLFKHDIYLIQKIAEKGDKMPHLKALYFVRPTKQNVDMILAELKDPRFQDYHLFFTNEITPAFIETLATNDPNDRIKSLQEVYLDYFAIGRNVYTLNIPSTVSLLKPKQQWLEPQNQLMDRMYQGLLSVIMSLRVIPQVRYLTNSDACFTLAHRLSRKLEIEATEKRSDYRIDDRAILIIMERKEDVVTPLLIPWTYQAMIHEFIGLANNKVDLVNKQKIALGVIEQHPHKVDDKKEFVLSELNDDFYAKNVTNTFGELANNIKKFIEEVGEKRNKAIKIESLEAMHQAIDKIPELTQISANVSKHVTLSCQISDQIEKRKLMEISKIQQDLVCQDNRKQNIDLIWKVIKGKQYQVFEKLKLVLLFSVKYPNDKEIKQFLAQLSQDVGDKNILNLTRYLQQYQAKRKSDLFNNSNIKKKAKSFFDNLFKDVPNVYTQHKSYLAEAILPQIVSGRLREAEYATAYHRDDVNFHMKPIVIIFQIGGTTFTEAAQSLAFADAKVVVGGTFIHNSKSMLGEIIQMGETQQQL